MALSLKHRDLVRNGLVLAASLLVLVVNEKDPHLVIVQKIAQRAAKELKVSLGVPP